jgi:hypothetical protein
VVDSIARFDPERRVVVGGSFQTGKLEARLTTRHGAERTDHGDALGFRCAASETRFVDLARNVAELDLGAVLDAFQLKLDLDAPLCTDRWTFAPGTATRTGRDEAGKPRIEPLPGYAVITAYDYALCLAATGLADSNLAELCDRARRDGRVAIGAFSTSRAIVSPELAPGTYGLALVPAESGAAGRLSFARTNGEIAATIDFARLEFGKLLPGAVELSHHPDGAPTDRIVVRGRALATMSQRGLNYEFTLACEPGSLGDGWRH